MCYFTSMLTLILSSGLSPVNIIMMIYFCLKRFTHTIERKMFRRLPESLLEAATGVLLYKKVLLRILQISKENTCVGI